MDNKIPKVFKNDIDSLGNNEGVFYSSNNSLDFENDSRSVSQKINSIFNSPSYVYKADVDIKLEGGSVSKRIVGRNNTHLITIENELIPIASILDIKKK